MGCTPSTPANSSNSSNNNGGAGGNQRAPDAASGEKTATFAASNKAAAAAASQQQHQHHRKGSLILTTTTSPALDGTSTRTSPTSVGTFYPNSLAVDHPSPEEEVDSTRTGTGSSHRNSSGNHSNNNTVLCCPRLFGFSCCQQCVYRANSGGSGSNRGGGGGGQRHHPYQNQQQQQQKQKQKRTISASLTGLHSMLDPECPSTGSNNKNWQLSTANNSSSTRSSCASLCSVCQQQQQLPQEQQPPVIISVNKATSQQQQQQQQQQWHLSTTGNCGSSSTSSDKKADKKKGASKKKKNSEKDNAVMRFGGGGGGGNATSLSSKDSEKLLLSHHNTTTATRESTDAADGAGGSGNVDEGQQQQQCCLKHQHRYYRQLYSGGGDPHHHHHHHCHCPSSSFSSSSAAAVVCPALPKCAHSSCSHSSQAVVVSSPQQQQQQSDTNNFISGSSLHQQTTASNAASSPADNSAAALNRRQSETARTSGGGGSVNNNNNNSNSTGAVNSNRGGNGSSGNRYQHQLQQSTSPISSSNNNNNTSVTTNSALLFDISSSKGKSMEKTAAVAGSATSGALFRGGSNKKHWASQSVRLGRMRIENKRAKALLVLETADGAASTVQQAAEQVDFSLSTVLHSAEAAFNAFVEHQPEVVIIDARRRGDAGGDASTTTRTVTTTNNNNGSYQHNDSSANNRSSNGNHFDPLTICKSIRDFKGGEFTCILALVSREQAEGESDAVSLLLQGGFNRCLVSSDRLSATVNELLQVREYELTVQRRLRAASALLVAVEACKDGVLITGPQHTIQYANGSIEKMFGFRVEELLGHQAQDYFQTDLLKAEIDERINNFNNGKGEWEGQIAHRRKSGDSVPIWNRILPVNYHNGSPEYIIYVKEFPFLFIEKLMSPETSDSSLTYGSLRGLRKTSFDVKSEVRRPSLAKFNSVSMIEAPITRVINILMAIKENGPSFLAPTLEKAIDILKNSEIFLPQFQSFKPEDQITSELVSSLINSSKQSGVRRMSHEAASNKSSLSLQANSNSAPTALQPPPSPSITSAGNSSSSSTTSASQSVTTTATANLLPLNSIATTSSTGQPSLSNIPSAVQALLEHQLDWNFNVIELERVTSKRPLTWLGMSILRHFNVPATLQCSENTIRNWLAVIEANYHDNPYHNSTHAADVMQATAFFLRSKRIAAALDPMDQAISLIAAIIHDIDHPGRNSAFLCNSSHQLAILYNDISVLESHHAARGFALTVGGEDGSKSNPEHSVNIFAALGPELYRDVRQSVIDMVLATDMTKHFEHLAKFIQNFNAVGGAAGISGALADDCETLLELENTESEADSQDTLGGGTAAGAGTAAEGANAGDLTPENIVLIKRMLIKCADVSNPARPLKLCQTWAERISTEYCDQTDEEKRLGLKVVMPTFDRATCSIPKSQIGFIDYFANDLFEAWHSFGDFPETVDNMNLNYQYWKDQQALLERKAKKLSLESTKVSEADEDEEAAEAEAFAEEDEGSSSVSAKL